MMDVFSVASYFISKQQAEAGDSLTNLSLQKLLYYAQGCSLALLDEPLFDDPIMRWKCGPVVKKVYDKFKEYNTERIPFESFDASVFDKKVIFALNTTYMSLGKFSAWFLKDLSMKTPPFGATKMGEAINIDEMKAFFKTQIIRQDDIRKAKK